jgi:hypothetical protein
MRPDEACRGMHSLEERFYACTYGNIRKINHGVLFKQAKSLSMTGASLLRRWRILTVCDNKRHMNRMAGFAGFKIHILCMF